MEQLWGGEHTPPVTAVMSRSPTLGADALRLFCAVSDARAAQGRRDGAGGGRHGQREGMGGTHGRGGHLSPCELKVLAC